MDDRPDQTFLEEADRELSRLSDALAMLGVIACLVAGALLAYEQTTGSAVEMGCGACDMPSCQRPSGVRSAAHAHRHDECRCSDCPNDCASDVS